MFLKKFNLILSGNFKRSNDREKSIDFLKILSFIININVKVYL